MIRLLRLSSLRSLGFRLGSSFDQGSRSVPQAGIQLGVFVIPTGEESGLGGF